MPDMIVSVWLAPGVAPVRILTEFAVAIVAAQPRFIVAPAVVTFPKETVVEPDPFAITTLLEAPEEDPRAIAPVCAVPPIVIVPVVVAAPTAYVLPVVPSKTKFPDPTNKDNDEAPVASPIVITLAAPVPIPMVLATFPVPIFIVLAALSDPTAIVCPPPVIATPPAPAAIVTAPLDPPIVVVAAPDALIDAVPSCVNAASVEVPVTFNPLPDIVILLLVVNVPVIAVFPVALPIATAPVPPVPIVVTAAPVAFIFVVPTIVVAPKDTGKTPLAKANAKLPGFIAWLSVRAPAAACAFVAKNTIPLTAVVDEGTAPTTTPAIAAST